MENSLTASDLAKLANVSPAAVWNWEKNGMIPRPVTVSTIASKLGVSTEFLLTGEDAKAPGVTSGNSGPVVSAPTGGKARIEAASLEELIKAVEGKGFLVSIRSRN
jgi:transcriptional regulator with XRE-family HTH domain